ncbi:MAG: hypothetical protein ACM3L6_04115 [Deltaproteobacteria bacterium]
MASSKKTRSALKMLIGAGVVVLGLLCGLAFFPELKRVVLGCLGPGLVLVGLVMIAVAKE